MVENFQVLFSGQVLDGFDEASVRDSLSSALQVDPRKVRQLFSGRTVVLKSGLKARDAQAWRERLEKLGVACRVKDLTVRDADPERAVDQTLQDITAAHQACERCGHMQLDASHCARCGFDMAAEARRRQKEDAIIEKRIRELRAKQTAAQQAGSATGAGPIAADGQQPRGKLGNMVAWLKRSK